MKTTEQINLVSFSTLSGHAFSDVSKQDITSTNFRCGVPVLKSIAGFAPHFRAEPNQKKKIIKPKTGYTSQLVIVNVKMNLSKHIFATRQSIGKPEQLNGYPFNTIIPNRLLFNFKAAKKVSIDSCTEKMFRV